MSDDKVVPFPKSPNNIRAEMTIRWLMQNMDQVEDLIVFVKTKGAAPIVSITTDTAPSVVAMAALIFQDMALDSLHTSAGPLPGPKATA